MRVLVTGGLGFVGYAVATVLAEAGHDVTVLTHRGQGRQVPAGVSTVVEADIRDRGALRDALTGRAFAGVCHLAALAQVRASFADPLGYFDANVSGTANLLHALADTQSFPPAVVFGSTGAIYGSAAEGRLSEESPADPANPYAASKYAAEQLLHYHAATGAIGATTLRCFAISGACNGVGDSDQTRIIPNTLRAAAGLIPHVSVNGDGSAAREFTHVLDVADAYRRALESTDPGAYRLFNVGSGQGITIKEVIDAVRDRSKRPMPVQHKPAKPEPHTLIANSTRIRSELGWSAPHSTLPQIIDDAHLALLATTDSPI